MRPPSTDPASSPAASSPRTWTLLVGLAYVVAAGLQPVFAAPEARAPLVALFCGMSAVSLAIYAGHRRLLRSAVLAKLAYEMHLLLLAGVAGAHLVVSGRAVEGQHVVLVLLASAAVVVDVRLVFAQAVVGATAVLGFWLRTGMSTDAATILVYVVLVTLIAVTVVQERVTVRRRLRAAMQRLELDATRDELTGLLNRRGLVAIGASMLTAMRGARRPAAVLFLDVDGLKAVNDTLGHPAGDAMLREVARKLEHVCRQSDIVARLGGDEFAVLLPGANREAAERIARDLRERVVGRAAIGLSWSVSVGVSELELGRADALEAALDEADQKMYANKQARKVRHLEAVAQA